MRSPRRSSSSRSSRSSRGGSESSSTPGSCSSRSRSLPLCSPPPRERARTIAVGVELELRGSKTGRVLQRGKASGSTPSSTIPRWTRQFARRLGVRRPLCSARGARVARSAWSSPTTSSEPPRASPTRMSDSPSRPRARAATAVELSLARGVVTPYAESSRRRSSSERASPASFTTRRGKR